MRNNKAILDEAARSVRRTFIGSVAGTADDARPWSAPPAPTACRRS